MSAPIPPRGESLPARRAEPDHVPAAWLVASEPPPSPLHWVNSVLRHPLLFVLLPLLFFAAAVVPGLLAPRVYESSATFAPQASSQRNSALSGLAAQFGIAVGGGEAATSPAFYSDLLLSRELLGRVVDTRFEYPSDTGRVRGDLVTILAGEPGADRALQRELTIDALEERTAVVPALKTGVVRVSVTTEAPQLSQQIVARMLALLNEFNLQRRQSQAAAERQFVEQRFSEVRAQLRVAEERLEEFQRGNRRVTGSASLQLTEERLQREVGMRSQLYTTLAQAYEQARVDEVRDTPVITVVEQPTIPVRPKRRGLVMRGLLALFTGLAIAAVIAAIRETLAAAKVRDRATYDEHMKLRRRVFRFLRAGSARSAP